MVALIAGRRFTFPTGGKSRQGINNSSPIDHDINGEQYLEQQQITVINIKTY